MATSTTALVLASYLGLYSAYSKATKSLSLALLLDILLVRRSLDFTLVEVRAFGEAEAARFAKCTHSLACR
jgi:hypothetical protein